MWCDGLAREKDCRVTIQVTISRCLNKEGKGRAALTLKSVGYKQILSKAVQSKQFHLFYYLIFKSDTCARISKHVLDNLIRTA